VLNIDVPVQNATVQYQNTSGRVHVFQLLRVMHRQLQQRPTAGNGNMAAAGNSISIFGNILDGIEIQTVNLKF